MFYRRRSTPTPESGLTLIELLVVVVIIGILAAIAAPSWLAFITNRRLETTNEDALQLFRQAQAQAIRTRSTRTYALDLAAAIPQATEFFDPANPANSAWEQLGTEINPDTIDIQVHTQVPNGNTWQAVTGATNIQIRIGHLGEILEIEDSNGNNLGDQPIAIAMVDQRTATTDPNTVIRRCFIIQSLLGSIREAEREDCPTG